MLATCLIATSCREYDIVIGRSCYQPHLPAAMFGWGRDVPYYMKEGDDLHYQGIYSVEPHGQAGLVRRFDRRDGWSYAILEEPLPVDEGTLVDVRGQVITVEQPITGTARIIRSHRLKVEDYEILCDTAPPREHARREYAAIRDRLQRQISLPGSKLRLKEEPQWRVDWLSGEDAIVVAAYSYDLMYAAEAEFLFGQTDGKLQALYFLEWFKGE
jgi:hypothetical protein